MTKQPKRKKCSWGCGLVPVEDFEQRMDLHVKQTELVPLEQYTIAKEPKARRRQRANGRLA